MMVCTKIQCDILYSAFIMAIVRAKPLSKSHSGNEGAPSILLTAYLFFAGLRGSAGHYAGIKG